MAHDNIFQTEAVQENVVMSLPDPWAASNTHDSDEDDGPSSLAPNFTLEQIPSSFAPAKDDNVVKQLVRNQILNFKSPLRRLMWRNLYLRMEAFAGSTTDPFNAIR